MQNNKEFSRSLPVAKPNLEKMVTTIENTGIVTILEHNKIRRRATALVHLGDKVIKVKQRRDRGLDHETGLQELMLALAKEDLTAGRANIIWELGE